MSNNLHNKIGTSIFHVTTVLLMIFFFTPAQAQNPLNDNRLRGLDLSAAKKITFSPNNELAAGLTVLHENKGTSSVIKVWGIKKKKLLHEFRVSGQAHAIEFSPDSSAIVTASGTGNLAWATTIRNWNLASGTGKTLGACIGSVRQFSFSHDGGKVAVLTDFAGFFEKTAMLDATGTTCICQIKAWRLDGEDDELSINITHPLPLDRWLPTWLPLEEKAKAKLTEDTLLTAPIQMRFSMDDQQIIATTAIGTSVAYDSQTGKILKHANLSSMNLFESILMLAIYQAPATATKLRIDFAPIGRTISFERGEDFWWQSGNDKERSFKVDGENYVSRIKDVEKATNPATLLGLKPKTNLTKLDSFEHPAGKVKIHREPTGIQFQLIIENEKTAREPIEIGSVQWTPPVVRANR
jgi:WD40 repeat protein